MKNIVVLLPIKVLLTTCLIVTATAVFAQDSLVSCSVAGTVKGDQNNALASATVNLRAPIDSSIVKIAATSDSGKFVFDGLKPSNYLLDVTMTGYHRLTIPVVLRDSVRQTLSDIHLLKSIKTMEVVVITRQKPLIDYQVDKVVLNVENTALAAGNNALELLQKAPGVTVDQDKISLKGKNGVLIMIDGKPTYLSQDQLASLLRGTMASAISSIELITNPSAKYDAAGGSGIINIRMKKNENYGTNGMIGASGGYGRYHKVDGSFEINHRQKAFNIFANYVIANRLNFVSLDLQRDVTAGGQTSYFNSSFYTKYFSTTHNFKSGIDFFLNSRNTLGLLVSGNLYSGRSDETGVNDLGSIPGKIDSSITATNFGRSPRTLLSYDLNYKSVFDSTGSNLMLSVDYSRSTTNDNINYNSVFTDENGSPYRPKTVFSNVAPTAVNIYVGKADYTLIWGKTAKLEAGAKYSYVNTSNDLYHDTLMQEGGYGTDFGRSNQFDYTEKVAAGYVSVSKDFRNTSIQAGVRGENTQSSGLLVTDSSKVDRKYFNLFPTFFIKQKLSSRQTIGFSYSRRIDRPDYALLNPFIYYIDQYTYTKGNPYLNPQYTHSLELNYILNGKYSASLNYSRTKDVISPVILTDSVTKVIYRTNQNLSVNNYYSLYLNAPVDFTPWWSSSNNFILFYSKYEEPNLDGAVLSLGKLAYQASTNQVFKISATSKVELNATYFSPSITGVFLRHAYYGIDFAFNQTFWNKKINVTLGVNDLLNTRGKQTLSNSMPNSNFTAHTAFDSRVIRLSVRFRFGNNKVKATEKESSAKLEENRLKKQ